jgi:hypothetical protein
MCLWKKSRVRIVTAARCTRSDQTKTLACGATKSGRYTVWEWKKYPAFGAMRFLRRKRRRSFPIETYACRATGNRRNRHSRTGLPWRGSTVMNATGPMSASSRLMKIVYDATRRKCSQNEPYTRRRVSANHATDRINGSRRSNGRSLAEEKEESLQERLFSLGFFTAVLDEKLVRLYFVNAAQRHELHQARVRFLARFKTRDITLRDSSPVINGFFRYPGHLAHREVVFDA